ncbi:MAG: molybdopterin synthase sulfur carrier subunit [Ponticaulis sp.]|nr:molybdopterin synthase sulfur carrier subunit [Ponticaulis sp.]|tara:strand:- start:14 stop:262 length:249 start_codon:yes stop_codon:yes gene_type:complete
MTQIIYFGRLGDVSGQFSEACDIPSEIQTVKDLRTWLDEKYSDDGAFSENTVRVALDNRIADDCTMISNVGEIALMPPVGGG